MKTPIMTAIERLKEQRKLVADSMTTQSDIQDGRMIQVQNDIQILESLLEEEREAICNFAISYVIADDVDTKSLFTQTFNADPVTVTPEQ